MVARTYENARDLAHNPEDLDHAKIAALWRTGCIIRAALLPKIKAAFERDAELSSLLLDLFFVEAIKAAQTARRRVVTLGVKSGIPIPAMSSALAYYDGYRTARLPANLL